MTDFLHLLRHPDELVTYIIGHGGLWLLMFIIFAETGLFAGFFLPGDSLLFVAGIFIKDFCKHLFKDIAPHTGIFHWHYLVVLTLVAIAAILGNLVGYWFGKKSGPLLYDRKDSFFFKQKHLRTAKKFFEEHGSTAIIMGRFLPIVRTFAPMVAGIVQLDRRKFIIDSIIGAFVWVFVMMLGGLFLQDFFLAKFGIDLSKKIELVAIIIIIITTSPVIYKFIKESRNKSSLYE